MNRFESKRAGVRARLPFTALLLLAIGTSVGRVSAATITVGGSGATAPSLSAAVSMATNGDEILIRTGTYFEIVSTTKALTIRADDGPGTVILDGSSFSSVLHFNGTTSPITIEGLVIQNGQSSRGAGIYCQNTLGTLTLIDCSFLGNIASLQGGALYSNTSAIVATNCVFQSNATSGASATSGGAVYLGNVAGSQFTDCYFQDNSTTSNGCVTYSGGCGFSGCSFVSNDGARGGAIYGSGGTTTITNSTFSMNTGQEYGGAVFLSSSATTIAGSRFADNAVVNSPYMGGAIYFAAGSSGGISDCIFDSNVAPSGGAVAGASNLTGITDCTFYGNATHGGGKGAAVYCNQSSPSITQNFFTWSSTGVAVWCESPSAPTFGCNLFWSNGAGDVDGVADPMGTDGNFSENPLFCDAADDNFDVDADSPGAEGNEPSECTTAHGLGAGVVACGASSTRTLSWGSLKTTYR